MPAIEITTPAPGSQDEGSYPSRVISGRVPAWSPWVVIKLLAVGLAVWAGGYALKSPAPLQEAMRGALQLTDNQLALMQGPAIALSIMAGAIPIGLLVDRYSRVHILLLFVVLDLVGSVLTALCSNFTMLFLARSLVGFAEIGSLIAAFSLVADLSSPAHRGMASMVVGGGSELGSTAAFAVGGALLVQFGHGADGWRWVILWMTLPPLVLIALLLLGLREPPRTGVVVKNPPMRAAFARLWPYRSLFLPLLMGRCTVWVADGAAVIWATPFLARTYSLSADRIGQIMAVVMLSTSVGSTIAGGVLADLCHQAGGPRTTMKALSGVALLSIPASFFGLSPSVPVAVGLLAVFILLGFITNMAGSALSTVVIPNEVRGTFMSLTMVVGSFFGVALAPMLVSWLSGELGGPLMIGKALAAVCVTFSVLGTATFACGSRYFPRSVA
jgi:MFS family permease